MSNMTRLIGILCALTATTLLVTGCDPEIEGCDVDACMESRDVCYSPPNHCGGTVGCDGSLCVCNDTERCDDDSCDDYCWRNWQEYYGPSVQGCWNRRTQQCGCYGDDTPYDPERCE